MPQTRSERTMSVDALSRKLASSDPPVVLDTRDDEARDEWRIPGSLGLDLTESLAPLDRWAPPRDAPIVAVCYRGRSSVNTARALAARGYEAYSLEGGMQAWSLAWNLAETKLPTGATLIQARRTGKGCLSYVVGDEDEAIVVDASLPPEIYERIAAERGWRIRLVLDTHVHADHLTRGQLLARDVGAEYRLPRTDRIDFAAPMLDEGDELRAGRARIRTLRTPGHTPESVSYLVDDAVLLTGDTLFVDGVGRPDLEASPEDAKRRARDLHASLQRLLALPGELLVAPAHASEPTPFDGRLVAATLRDAKARVTIEPDAEAFASRLVARLPPTPPNHAVIVRHNEQGTFPAEAQTELEAGANRCAIR